jgi:hypothetical protein
MLAWTVIPVLDRGRAVSGDGSGDSRGSGCSRTEQSEQAGSPSGAIEVPAPTSWPLVLAFGFTLMRAGLLTSVSLSILGAVLMLAGSVGWFREVLPRDHEIVLPVLLEELPVVTERHVVDQFWAAQNVAPNQVCAWLPVRTHPVSAGVRGGLAGAVAMAAIACVYGLLKVGSIWYPINLLAASIYEQSTALGSSRLNSFHADSFLVALILHGIVSTVGLLYGAMLPMFPRRPILLGSLIGPVLWSGLLYSMLSLLNPLLESHIDWLWFVASQVAYGVVAGIVVVRQPHVTTRENIPFAVRAAVEAPGMMPGPRDGEV